MVRFCPVVSGSSGNSVYIGTEHTNVLIDAGLSGKSIEKCLKQLDVEVETLDGIFITHEHSDHVKGVGVLSRRYDLPVFATEGTWEALETSIGVIAKKNKNIIYSGERFRLNDIIIKPFDIPHDAVEPVGYSVFADDIKMTVATDMGHITDEIKNGIADSHVILLEANHDVNMVRNGAYPYPLKKRILSDLGHLSNENAGQLLAQITTEKLKHVFLGHLSLENNSPALAYKTVSDVLFGCGITAGREFCMEMANRSGISSCIRL